MSDQFTCPECSNKFSEREFRTTIETKVKECCPKCGAIIREGGGTSLNDANATTTEDISSISAWLSEEGKSNGLLATQIRDKEGLGQFKWTISNGLSPGCPENWEAELIYETSSPRKLSVRITTTEAGLVDARLKQITLDVFGDHALQPHAENIHCGGSAGPEQKMKWGPEVCLKTFPLSAGLLRPVLARLTSAMRDAITTRDRKAGHL